MHQADAGPGVFAPVAAARGCELVEWTPANGPPPAAAAGCGGVLVLGGAMHPNQDADHPWLADEKRRLEAFLETIAVTFSGGPVGLSTLAAAVDEEQDTIEDVYEPYLLQQGLIKRTPRGRVVTERGYGHLGLPVPEGLPSLF